MYRPISLLGGVALLGVLALAGCGTGDAQGSTPLTIAEGGAPATPEVAEDLTFLREEEKLARDVYLALHDQWGLQIFDNISSSEQRHTDRVAVLLEAKELADPVDDDTVGTFTNDELAELYADLVAAGNASEVAALQVGATIEDLDLADIAEMAARTTDPDVLGAYDALACGSRNHLRAFTSQLAANGVTYEAQYLTGDEVASILATPKERCGKR